MSVYDPSGSGDVHISKAISGKKRTGVVPVPGKKIVAKKKGVKKSGKKNK